MRASLTLPSRKSSTTADKSRVSASTRALQDFSEDLKYVAELEEVESIRNGTANVDPASDPFAPRPGRTLTWSDVSMSVRNVNQKDGEDKKILESLSGRINPQALSAIMGHSGAGKTSLLNVLAGKAVNSRAMQVSRKMTLDDVEIDPTSIAVKRKIAFVAQRDTLLSTATPREAIRFSAKLRLQKDITDDEIEALVDRILRELRLDHVADSMTGGESFRGLSGGEMRRLSLGIELVVRPSILFCDEVTSGLDSHNAAAVMEVLKQVATCGASVLMTIHQPNSKVFNLIDHLILMNRGRCMYQGSVQDVPQYFTNRCYPVPRNYNPADWILEVSQVNTMETLSAAGFFAKDDPPTDVKEEESTSGAMDTVGISESETKTSPGSSHVLSPAGGSIIGSMAAGGSMIGSLLSLMMPELRRLSIFDTIEGNRVNLWTEVKVQVIRDLQRIARDGRAMMLRFMIVVVASTIIGIAFMGAGDNSLESTSTFSSHVGAMYFLIMGNMMALQLIMLDQIEGRPIFVREFETDHFRMISYAIGRVIIEAITMFLTVLIMLLIVYWAIGLDGRFWYWLLAMYTFAMIMTSTGVALASYTKDPREAKELIPMTLLPQILVSGFFISVDSLPSFLQWLQWVFPLTYTFRLILSEEFSYCIDEEQQQQVAEQCLQSLLHSLEHANGKFEAIYQEDSLVRLAQTGQYSGTKDIQEYYGLFSTEAEGSSVLVLEACQLDGSLKMKFNGLSEDGVCDLTLAEVTQGKANPALVRDELLDHAYTQYVYGHRLRFTHSSDLDSVHVITHDLYFPQEFTFGLLTHGYDNNKMVDDICTTLHDRCPESWARDGYENFDECLSRMLQVPITNLNEKGLEASDGNSTSCRAIHSNLVKQNADHCPHISYFPELDVNDQYKCVNGYDVTFSDFYDEADMDLFGEVAAANNLGEKQLIYGLSVNDTKTCRDNGVDREREVQASLSDEYVTTKVCANYLENQNATGENNGAYWGALIAMFVVMRLTGLCLMRNLVRKSHTA